MESVPLIRRCLVRWCQTGDCCGHGLRRYSSRGDLDREPTGSPGEIMLVWNFVNLSATKGSKHIRNIARRKQTYGICPHQQVVVRCKQVFSNSFAQGGQWLFSWRWRSLLSWRGVRCLGSALITKILTLLPSSSLFVSHTVFVQLLISLISVRSLATTVWIWHNA